MTNTNILCVDSDRNLCQILAKALNGEGYAVRTAFDGETALQAIEEEQPALVLLDLFLPKRDGFSVLEGLRKLPEAVRTTPVVLMTGCSPTPEYRRRAKSLGAKAILVKPVPLAQLLASVRKRVPLGEGSGAVCSVPVGRDRTSLTGCLERFPLPALLHQLHGLRGTGVLHLTKDRKRKWIELRDGYPVSIRSNLVSECLGNYLVRSGRITQAAAAESHRRMEGGRLQGEVLVAMDVMSEAQVATCLRAQAEEKIFEIFSWEYGSFNFERGGRLPRANSLGVERSPANLILRGVCTRFPMKRVDAFFDQQLDATLVRAENPFYRFQEIDLDPELERLVVGLDGTQRLEHFLGHDEEVRRSLYALIVTGVLEARGGTPGAERRLVRARRPAKRRAARETASDRIAAARVVGLDDQGGRVAVVVDDDARRAELLELADRFRGRSYYEILGVDRKSSDDEIRVAYEQLCECAHPDRVSAASDSVRRLAEQVFRQVARAYEVLSDPRRSAAYSLDQRKLEREAKRNAEEQRHAEGLQEFQEGERRLSAKDHDMALRHFGRALELVPDEGEHHAHYGWALHLCHPKDPAMVQEAVEHIKRGIKLADHREKPYLFLGCILKSVDRIATAEKMFEHAIQIQPDCVEALRELRLINMRREKSKGFVRRILRR